ncbi:stage II sporulation protein M [Candidatus Woesearchaeota archaeon]|nr:MAG: stage II sporulation protein M [Candidatus Woesearchaeota archaeon]
MFEQLFTVHWIEQKPWFAFILGFCYSVFGVFSAFIVFPENVGMMSIAFTSMLIIPSLNNLLSIEENKEIREKKLSMKLLFKDHKDMFEIYVFLFLGMLLTYSVIALILPDFTVKNMFASQLSPFYGGNAYAFGTFLSILQNNFVVLCICLLLSLAYGAGSILFLTWNASVWGSIFGFVAKQSANVLGQNPFQYFALTIIKVFPHMIMEASSYFFAVIAGGVISKAIIREKANDEKFKHVFTDGIIFFCIALILLLIAAWLEVYLFPKF